MDVPKHFLGRAAHVDSLSLSLPPGCSQSVICSDTCHMWSSVSASASTTSICLYHQSVCSLKGRTVFLHSQDLTGAGMQREEFSWCEIKWPKSGWVLSACRMEHSHLFKWHRVKITFVVFPNPFHFTYL